MSYRIIGAILIITGCGGFGLSLIFKEKHREHLLQSLLSALRFMQWELQFRLTPLPDLLHFSGKQAGGEIEIILSEVSRELQEQILPDVNSCMQKVLQNWEDLPRSVKTVLKHLGKSLGCFDLSGQLEGLSAAQADCERELSRLEEGKAQRFRSYETLGLCAGAAVAILFF